jgi:hypothetical protein
VHKKLNSKRTTNQINKWANELHTQFSEDEAQVAYEEMFNILRHKENANQMMLRLHLTPVRMAISKKRNKKTCR